MKHAKSPSQLDREIAEALVSKSGTGRRIDRKKLGEMMSPWGGDSSYGSGAGAVGAVSSYYYSGKPYPDRAFVERAIVSIEADVPKAEHGAHGWTKADAKELRKIAQGLRYYLHHDYQEKGGRAHSTIATRDESSQIRKLIDSYGTWSQSYSNEDMDRYQGLANRLTAVDRAEGRPAPAAGYSKERYALAKKVVDSWNRHRKDAR